jgi:microcompartment protein CcmK/EutM
MLIAVVIGTAISTIRINKISQAKLKVVSTINPFNEKESRTFIVEDAVGVGVGEKVIISDDDEAVSEILNISKVPMRAAIVAKIEKINIF